MGPGSRLYWGTPGVLRHYAAAYRRVSLRAWVLSVGTATVAGAAVGALLGAWQNGGLAGFALSATTALVYRGRGRQATRALGRSD